MKFILVTCIDPKSSNSREWNSWPGNSDNGIKKYSSGEDMLFVVKGQGRFEYDNTHRATKRKDIEELKKVLQIIEDIINDCQVDMSSDAGALLIHYGSGYIHHGHLQEVYNAVRDSVKTSYEKFDASINHTSDFIISSYSIGGDRHLAGLLEEFRQNRDILNKIIAYLREKYLHITEEGKKRERLSSLDDIYYLLVPLRFYVDAYLKCKESENGEKIKEKIKELIDKVEKIKFDEIKNSVNELAEIQEINSDLLTKIIDILDICEQSA